MSALKFVPVQILFLISLSATIAFASNEIHCTEAPESEVEELSHYVFPDTGGGPSLGPYDERQQHKFFGYKLTSPLSETSAPLSFHDSSVEKIGWPMSKVGQCAGAVVIDEPEKIVQPGDILINFNRHAETDSRDLRTVVEGGANHSAMVMTWPPNSAKKIHLDFPFSSSDDNFREDPKKSRDSYHILRLRLVPPEITTTENLKLWLKDPDKRKKLKEFLTERNCKIKKVQFWNEKLVGLNFANKIGYSFSNNIGDKSTSELQDQVLNQKNMKLTCVEHTLLPFKLAGMINPGTVSLREKAEAIHKYISRVSEKYDISREQAAIKALNFADATAFHVNAKGTDMMLSLVAAEAMNQLNLSLTTNSKKIATILSGDPDTMAERLAELPFEQRKMLSMNSPGSVLQSAQRSNSDFVYVGTYIPGLKAPKEDRSPPDKNYKTKLDCSDKPAETRAFTKQGGRQ
jgi:hypothetical protein